MNLYERRIPLPSPGTEPRPPARARLLASLRERGVPDSIVAAFAAVPRERFLPPERWAEAYEDRALAIGEEQTISQPYMIARMFMELALRGDERVLDIGTGSGYQAALLGELCREVHSIEVRPALYQRAQALLTELGHGNVHCYLGNGRLGLPAHAPYDAIICAAATSEVPQALVDQLAVGGRLALPVGDEDLQWLKVAYRTPRGAIQWTTHDACTFVPLVHGSCAAVTQPLPRP